MFYVGGNCGNSNVELHDVRFSIGKTPEDCHEDLREQWWGDPESLYLDCWGAVEQADGFDVVLTMDARKRGLTDCSSSISAATTLRNSASCTATCCWWHRRRKPPRQRP